MARDMARNTRQINCFESAEAVLGARIRGLDGPSFTGTTQGRDFSVYDLSLTV